MVDEKKTRGRPRIYATNAERKKAYRERKKEERILMEARIDELEKKLGVHDEEEEYLQMITFKEIHRLNTEELHEILNQINAKVGEKTSLLSIFSYLIDSLDRFKDKLVKQSGDRVSDSVLSKLISNKDHLQHLILQYIVHCELAQREDGKVIEDELELLEKRIGELESEAYKKKVSILSELKSKQ